MLELLTNSGAIIHTEAETPAVRIALDALGGLLVQNETDATHDAVTSIIEQNVLGSTLTDSDGKVYLLTNDGWYYASDDAMETYLSPVPPVDSIVAGTLPGGWSWSA